MKKSLFILAFLTMAFFSVARPTFAQSSGSSYQLLAPIPLNGVNSAPAASTDISTYIRSAITLITALAGGAAVVLIMYGGFKYVTSATGIGKETGRDTIQNALIGLLLVIGAYTILYTINPALVKFNLALSPVPATSATAAPTICVSGDPTCTTTSSSTNPFSGGGGFNGGGASGSWGDGTPICANCVPVPPGIPQKAPGTGCAGSDPCTVNATLAGELQNLTNSFGASGWQVTEMYPPTVVHISDCHNNGTCVDVALSANPSGATIATFLNDVHAAGFSSYVYEACGSRLTQLQSDPALKGYNIQCEPTTTGENAHLNQ